MSPNDADSPDGLLQFSDTAMYEAKKKGRGAHSYFSRDIESAVVLRQTMRSELYVACERGELILHYQPIVSIERGNVVGFEALLRWAHPTRGLLLPSEFLPQLEDMGLFLEIGPEMLRNACLRCREWQLAGYDSIRVAINLSAQEFYRGDLVGAVDEALRQSKISGHLLELELTETITLDTSENTLKVMEELKCMGVKLSLDDFGTGWSSLSYLSRFPLDRLKIDGNFIRDLRRRPAADAIVESILSLGRNLGLICVGEGVESQEQLAFLLRHQCPEIQGFLFSKAVSPDLCLGLLSKRFDLGPTSSAGF